MLPATTQRVPEQTPPEVNARIRRQTDASIGYFAAHPEEIEERLRELDREWDIERVLETGSSVLSLTGLTLSLLSGRRRWLLLPLAVQSFFLQHALQGWCPPLPAFRSLGVRTQTEIERERHALERLRRDFMNEKRRGSEQRREKIAVI
jgi:hypothetical protein